MSESQRFGRVYEFLVDEEDSRVCKDIGDAACRVVPGNFLLILLAQFINKLADTCSSAKLVIPWLFASAGVPAFFSGLLVPIRESGSLLPQLAIAGVMRKWPKRKWFLVIGYTGQGLGLIAMAWVATHMEGAQAGWGVLAVLVFVSLSRGFSSVASKDVIGKTIPKTRRGSLNGYSASAAGVITLLFGIALALQLTEQWQNLAPLLIAAACFSFITAVCFGFVNEYSGAVDGGGNALKAALQSASILLTDSDFRLFISVRALMMCSGLSAPFFILIAQSSGEDQGLAGLGMFVLVGGLASMISGVVWGRFSDSSSRKVLIATALMIAVLCAVAALFEWLSLSALSVILGLYFCLSIVHEGVRVGRKTYVLDLAGGQKRTDYVAVGNTLIGVLLLVVGVLTAVLANQSVFWALILFALMALAAAALATRLPEV
ncbi:MFS transporter [Halioxenophilus aromaticivorans]